MHLVRSTLLFSIWLLVFLAVSPAANAQLEVQGGLTAEEVAAILVGSGVSVSNVTIDCPTDAFGTFNGEFTTLGITEGIMLTSGSINNAVGPNNASGASTSNGTDGDNDLNELIAEGSTFATTTQDACILEFDFVPLADTLSFNYVFGSEEYLEYVNSSFNDVFAFFISGPNPAGGTYVTQNIAFIPGTSTAVSINNLNDVDYSEYYINNGDGFIVDPESTVQYDGLTVILEASAPVILRNLPPQNCHCRCGRYGSRFGGLFGSG